MNRPAREGTKKQAVEKVLEAAAAKRATESPEKVGCVFFVCCIIFVLCTFLRVPRDSIVKKRLNQSQI